jgi:micrococcal nuclease
MRRLFPLLALALAGCQPTAEPAKNLAPDGPSVLDTVSEPTGGEYPVTRIVDGDTLHLDRNGEDVTVRLLRINTRERGEWGYKQGQTELKRLVEGKRVRLASDDEPKDRYGRELAYIFVGDKNINLEMVRSGWSPFFTRYGKGQYADAFAKAEAEAREAKRGLWARPEEAKKNDEMGKRKTR